MDEISTSFKIKPHLTYLLIFTLFIFAASMTNKNNQINLQITFQLIYFLKKGKIK